MEALKALPTPMLKQLHQFIVKFWIGETDFPEWHEALLTIIPKSGNLSDPSGEEFASWIYSAKSARASSTQDYISSSKIPEWKKNPDQYQDGDA